MSSGNPETRRRILDAAWAALEEAGGQEVRVGDIAKRAGVSRQAVYLHFPTRTELLNATTRHVGEALGIDARLAESRAAPTGEARLDAFVRAWGGFVPEIQAVLTALMVMAGTDPAARAAYDDRMAALREGCAAAVAALARDGRLRPEHTQEAATDLLLALLSLPVWEDLTRRAGWTPARYTEAMQALARRALVAGAD